MQSQETQVLSIENLTLEFPFRHRKIFPVRSVSFSLFSQKLTALVGESGCGKSLTAFSILRLVPSPGKIAGGHILFQEKDLMKLSENEIRKIRGKYISMVFQEPMTSLNPVYTVENQLSEVLMLHQGDKRKLAKEKIVEMLKAVGIRDPSLRIRNYPHQLSGGMRQRIMLAMALLCHPQILVADEPTTALDVTVQAQIMALLKQIQSQFGMAILFITHDLSLVAHSADHVMVMYAGSIVEKASAQEIFSKPYHPYTIGLIASAGISESKENFSQNTENITLQKKRFLTIEGQVPSLLEEIPGCKFFNRCSKKMDICQNKEPQLQRVNKNSDDNRHQVACHLYE